ncbi:MAG: aldo/keto reductase, partial [Elusimicrobiaceae bacterium]|nr:aldo/keto reductase [Elusimicrobiaceae bacterium]
MNETQMAPLILPPVGLGGWPFGAGYDWGPLDEPQAQKAVLAALEAGICFVDTAPVYGDGASEQFLGRVLSSYRHQVLLADKCGLVKNGAWTDHDLRPATIRRQLEESLSRLKTDYLDLYQIHYPDPHVPLEEAVGELDNLRREGKIRAIGLCNVSAQQI